MFMKEKILEGKVAVVAGSGQGIGRSIALGLGEAGAEVITNNRRPGSTGNADRGTIWTAFRKR